MTDFISATASAMLKPVKVSVILIPVFVTMVVLLTGNPALNQ